MRKVTFNSENWVNDTVTVNLYSNGDFTRNGDRFSLVYSDVPCQFNEGDEFDIFTTTFTSEYGDFHAVKMACQNHYECCRDDGAITRSGKTALEAVVKMVEMMV